MERILDTSVLVQCWRARLSKSGAAISALTTEEASSWARDLAVLNGSRFIVTPVIIEFVAGARNSRELKLFRAFLSEFKALDDGVILKEDWAAARNRAERVPHDSKPRHLGDCLIRAIADRFRRDVATLDLGFPSR